MRRATFRWVHLARQQLALRRADGSPDFLGRLLLPGGAGKPKGGRVRPREDDGDGGGGGGGEAAALEASVGTVASGRPRLESSESQPDPPVTAARDPGP